MKMRFLMKNQKLICAGLIFPLLNQLVLLIEAVASAMEYDTDALADVESEVDSHNRYRPSHGIAYGLKKEHQYSMSKQGGICPSNEHEEICRDQFLDFQSIYKSNTSDDGSKSFFQETSSSPYDKHRTAMEHDDGEVMPFPSSEASVEGNTHSNPLGPSFKIRSSFGEISDGFNHAMSNPHKKYGSYWADAAASALLGLNLSSVGLLSTKKQDRAGYQDTEGHVRLPDLTRKRNPADARVVKGSFDSKYEYSHSRNWGSGQISISVSDHQEVGSQCSSSISPRYLVDAHSSCEKNKMEEFRRPQDAGFQQYDQDMKHLDDNHGHVSGRLHLDTIIDSTSSRTSEWNSELTNHSSPSIYALSGTHSSQESLGHLEEAFLKSDFHFEQISVSEEASAAGSRSLDKNLKSERRELTAGRPHGSFLHSGRDSGELIMRSNFSPSNASDVKAGVDGELEKPPDETQGGGLSFYTSIQNPAGFPFAADSTLLVDNTVDMGGQHTYLRSEEVIADSSMNHPKTFLEVSESDTISFAGETQQKYSCLHTSETAADDIDSGYTIQVPVPLVGDTAACTKETIQPKPAADTIIPTTQLSVASKSIKPLLGDSVCEFNASDIPVHSKDQSSDDSTLHCKGEHEAQSPEEKIIQCVEMHGSQTRNEVHHKQEINSSEQEKLWSSDLRNHEDEIPVEKPKAKLRRPHNSLIESNGAPDRSTSKLKKVTSTNRPETFHVESLSALDKSKSKKVTPYSLPETPSTIGRDSILEVIRTKSFNLKPTSATVPKPIVRAPTMNIKVSAILEKANRIRQATRGSDEEDEWSD